MLLTWLLSCALAVPFCAAVGKPLKYINHSDTASLLNIAHFLLNIPASQMSLLALKGSTILWERKRGEWRCVLLC